MIISFLDNAASRESPNKNSSSASSAKLWALDKDDWAATELRSYTRPDGRFTFIRGNFQQLPGGASLAHWSDNNYFSEYDASGRMVQEARLQSNRFESYRTYKFNWTSPAPVEEPAVKALVYGTGQARATTAIYVSWNGATEVAAWRFYSVMDGSERIIATVPRRTFETVSMVDEYIGQVRAKAFDASGHELGASSVVAAEVPVSWATEDDVGPTLRPPVSDVAIDTAIQPCTASLAVIDLARSTCTATRMYDSSSLMTLTALMVMVSGVSLALVRLRRRMARVVVARKAESV